MGTIESKILNALLDQYEKSKTFSGENKVNQNFKISVGKLFPKYNDSAEYDFYSEMNAICAELEKKNFITVQKEKSGKIKTVTLNQNESILSAIYDYLHRTPRKETQSDLLNLLDEYADKTADTVQEKETASIEISPLKAFIAEQKFRIEQNKNVEHFNGDIKEFNDILKGMREVLANEEEVFVRDFSVRVYGDSKRFEKLQSAITSILVHYGDYEDKETALSEYGIVKTPTYVCVKGNGVVTLGNQKINLSALHGDIAFSTQSLKEISQIAALGTRVVTIENLTSFHDYKETADFVLYLGGFHNKVKRDFLCMLHAQNPQKEYLHFGDIDAGGFYILNHLKKRTGIPFKPLYMDISVLQKYTEQTKPLTNEDKKRLKRMLGQSDFADFAETIRYMLAYNCKLEQENIIV